jgi:hypothetical protein
VTISLWILKVILDTLLQYFHGVLVFSIPPIYQKTQAYDTISAAGKKAVISGQNQGSNFLQILLPTLISSVVIISIFVIDKIIQRIRTRRNQKRLYLSVLRAIYYDFKKNLDLMCQLHAYLYCKLLPSFSLELSWKGALIETLVPVCLNFSLLNRIYYGYFELVHIQTRVDQYRESYGNRLNDTLRKGTYALINNDIKRIFGILSEIAKEVNTKAASKERIDELPEDYLAEKFREFQEDLDVMSTATKHEIDLSKRERFDGLPAPETQASGNEVPLSGSYG